MSSGRYDRVLVSLRDRGDLRSLSLAVGLRSAVVGIFLSAGEGALTLVPRPEWPALQGIRARGVDGGWLTVLRFEKPVDVGRVVAELGRQAVWPDRVGNRGVWVAGLDSPPDGVALDVVSPPGARVIGPYDERVVNPIGFDPLADGPVVSLSSLDLADGVTEGLVAALRSAAAVEVSWEGAEAAAVVAGLALAGVPLLASEVPAGLFDADLAAALTASVDLSDALAREEHSIVQRRLAFDRFSTLAARRTLGDETDVPVAAQAAVSIVLATRRPEQVEFALRQVAKQRGVESLELVLAPHGFSPDGDLVRGLLPPRVALQVLPQPERVAFGDVLDAACRAAGGDVLLKMDDDDWYGPDVVADLLRARAYSGAELVGMAAELHYLSGEDLTVKRGHPVECYASFVAGGTMMVERALLREVGGFRSVRKFVDAQLLASVTAAGAAIFRTQSLGYLLRRNPTGHTWDADLAYLLDPSRVQRTWDGFVPSRLMEIGPEDLP
ncbi:glycosyltransferase [Nocardioides szechwanensis]|uniref:glycosyltransferase n=1 Tax=Nocardioides szechwanensis TaxID=1005944 RepID=UPI00115F8C6F|nr:glycosyltransferase family 2 protein [Nocardioides szechwanensis]